MRFTKQELPLILFQGDSITDAGRGREDSKSLGTGYVFLIASRLGYERPNSPCRVLNRGIGGNRSIDVYARWKKNALLLKPNLISILLGVNDVGFDIYEQTGVSADKFKMFYRLLLEEAKAANPDLAIMLCEPFILPEGKVGQDWEQWKDEMKSRQEIVRELAYEFHAAFVPLQHGFDEAARQACPAYWLSDGIHPTPAGHQLIAREWMNAFKREVTLPRV